MKTFLAQFSDFALLLMRLMVGVVFVSSGWSHTKDPVTRGKSIGLSPGFTRFLGLAELFGGAGVALGILTHPGDARGHSEKDLRLAYRVLGKIERWLALRSAVRHDVSGHRHHWRRTLRSLSLS